MLRERRILLIVVNISLFLLLGITYPVSSNDEKENKTIEDRIQEYYSETINFGESSIMRTSYDEIPEGSLEAKLEIGHPPKIDETASHKKSKKMYSPIK